ncbi:PilT domain-containing protein [Rhizobium sp. N6212]|nr:PilT domain-containing protein [Rhizobium sp. N6212]ANK95896.1 PilT domain-containing protein [Rhizobium sp. N621]ANL01924.1 PilT domain-containing protein [Rhizobium esperanzae]ANL08052.1 PilT domain-containing protein [Rhizobium sp. N1341]ANL20098.1 PilT domain-containing protein [Rhizobium sp. N113]ANM32775.1 PilT domain-containing protein [Rhizobium sp. N871]ANM38893.1 PilT domain-containing protein [Rhizobium sp. N741]
MIVIDTSALIAIFEKEADCAAYALAKSLSLPLLFKGDDFAHTDIEPWH